MLKVASYFKQEALNVKVKLSLCLIEHNGLKTWRLPPPFLTSALPPGGHLAESKPSVFKEVSVIAVLIPMLY
jgi:hypothetical protein